MKNAIRRRKAGRTAPGLEGLEARTLMSGPGSLDPSFGGGTGSATISLGVLAYPVAAPAYNTQVESVVVAPGGKIVESGIIQALPSSTFTIAVARFNADGSTDTTFKGGEVQLPLPAGALPIVATAVQPDGRIILALEGSDAGGQPTYLAMRLNADGSLDTAFGTSGVAEYPPSTTVPAADRLQTVASVVIQANGQIIVAGTANPTGMTQDFAAARLNADGSLDTSFGGGTALAPLTIAGLTIDATSSAALQSNGQVVLAGTARIGTLNGVAATEAAAVRLNTDGSVDTSFVGGGATGGVALPSDPANPSALASTQFVAVAVQPADQKIVVSAAASGSPDAAANGGSVYRLTTSGALDTTFGTAGRAVPSFAGFNPDVAARTNPSNLAGNTLALEPNGQVVVLEKFGTYAVGDSTTLGTVVVARLNANGSADKTFGNTTTITTYQPGLKSLGQSLALAIQPADGKVVVGGTGIVAAASGQTAGFAVARLLSATSTGVAAVPPADTPPAAFDGTGRTNLAVFLPALGDFAFRPTQDYATTSTGSGGDQLFAFGSAGPNLSVPATADYQGTGVTQIGVYLPASGTYVERPSAGSPGSALQFGVPGIGQTIPVPADYEGTGAADVAIYIVNQALFAILPSNGAPGRLVSFGTSGPGQSIPAPADYYGTHQDDVAVYLAASGYFAILSPSGTSGMVVPFGIPGVGQTIPVPGDYDGAGHAELAVYIPSLGAFFYRSPVSGKDVVVPIGTANSGQIPAPGDYDGSGRTEVAIFDPAKGFFEYIPAKGGAPVITYFGSNNGGSIPLPTPPADLPIFTGEGSGMTGHAIRPGFAPAITPSPASIPQVKASSVPAGPVLTSFRVARALVNQASTDPSKPTI